MPEFFVGKMIFFAVDICIKKDGQSRPVLVAQKILHPEPGSVRGGGFLILFLRGLNGESLLKNTSGEKNSELFLT